MAFALPELQCVEIVKLKKDGKVAWNHQYLIAKKGMAPDVLCRVTRLALRFLCNQSQDSLQRGSWNCVCCHNKNFHLFWGRPSHQLPEHQEHHFSNHHLSVQTPNRNSWTMAGPAASATSVGAGSPRAGGGSTVRQRGSGGAKSSGSGRTTTRAGGTSSGGMWRFYSDDSPGIKV